MGDFYLTFIGRVVGLWVIQFFPKLKLIIPMRTLFFCFKPSFGGYKVKVLVLSESKKVGQLVTEEQIIFKKSYRVSSQMLVLVQEDLLKNISDMSQCGLVSQVYLHEQNKLLKFCALEKASIEPELIKFMDEFTQQLEAMCGLAEPVATN